MSRYHLNPKGNAAICRAQAGNCPFGGSEAHYPTALEARQAFELAMSSETSVKAGHEWPRDWAPEEKEFWSEVSEKLPVRVFQNRAYVLGSSRHSNYYCLRCYSRLQSSSLYSTPNWTSTCEACGDKVTDGLVGIALGPGTERFFQKDEVYKTDWFHYSQYPQWESLLLENVPKDTTMVHLGTEQAAKERRLHTKRAGGQLYRVRVKPAAVIADEVFEDDPFNEESAPLVEGLDSPRGVLRNGVNRYMNFYEDPGSVSLLVDPRCLELISVTTYSE